MAINIYPPVFDYCIVIVYFKSEYFDHFQITHSIIQGSLSQIL